MRIAVALIALGLLLNTSIEGRSVYAIDQGDTQSDSTKKGGLPLAPARTVSISTTEASWLSLDVSPDGRTIVFDYLGDLYTLPFGGGTATQLTSGMAFDGQPRYSPDGTKIVYTSDASGGEGLWIIDLVNGDTTQLTTGKNDRYQSPEWTPDGKYIISSRTGLRSGVPKLRMWHVDGGSGADLIAEPNNLKSTGAAFGPDGRYIWFAQRTSDWQYNAIFPQYQLAVYDRETGQRYTRTSRYGSGIRPTLSPDGRWLVYGTRHDAETGLIIRDLENGEERWLAYPVQHDDQESRGTRDALPGMSFTPDSRELLASYGGKIWRIPVDGSAPTEIPFRVNASIGLGPQLAFSYPIDDAPTFTVRQIRDAVPSPDGNRLAFVAMDRLYVMDYPDGTPRRLTNSNMTEAQPVWSPDGQSIAYVTWSETDGGHVFRMRSDGTGNPQQLTTRSAIYQQPAWSPNGERLVLISGSATAYRDGTGPRAAGATDELTWIPAGGGDAVSIAPTAGRSTPHFAGNSDRIYLTHGSRGLVSIRWDGSDERAHVRVTGTRAPGSTNPPNANTILMAPTGDQALAEVGADLYVVTVPMVGGDTPVISVANPDNAAFPAKRLTDIGGQFPVWGANARSVHWSIGNAHLVYDLDAAEAFEGDSGESYEPAERRIEIQATRDMPEGTVVLRGARVISMRGNEIIENTDVVIRNNRIVGVGARGSVTTPNNATIIDVAGKTIVPGYVDVHAHMRPAWDVHKPDVWTYLANLAYGVTTTRDPQTATTDVLSYGDMVDAGAIIGPRIYSTGPGVFWDEQIKSLDHARDVLKRYSEYYHTNTIKMYVAGNREMRQWIIMAAREQRLMPTTEGSLNLKLNMTEFLDGYPGHEHSYPVFPLYTDFVQLAAQSAITYTPTLVVAYGGPWAENYYYTRENPHDNSKVRRFLPHSVVDGVTRRRGQGAGPGPGGWFMDEEHVFKRQAQVAKDIVEAGGRVGVGSHGQFQGLGYHWELWSVASGGMNNHDALRTATIFGAEAIGLHEDLGTVETGKLADLVVLDANPLDNIRNTEAIRYVIKNGRIYEGATLNEIWPRQRTTNIPAHWNETPATRAGLR